MKHVIVVCGPTATGKSALTVKLAQQYNGEIISADSRQVYTGLDIGSAKITETEMQDIPHHMIDIVHPNEYFSVANFQEQAIEKINEIHNRGKLPIICGGTGMYIDAVIYNTQFPEVLPNEKLRENLEKKTAKELFYELEQLDKDRSRNIDKYNKVRLIRAIEIATELGTVPKLINNTSNYNTFFIGLELSKETLQERIITRINNRIPELFNEIKKLHSEKISFERLESFGLEYRFGSEYVQEKINLEEFKELLANKTWQFAKRQMTWFKRNSEIHWFNPINDQQKILKQVQDFIEKI